MLTDQDFIQNVAVLNESLRREAWYGTFWHNFTGDVKVIPQPGGKSMYVPSGKPVERLTDFADAGRDNMLIPFRKRLVGAPVFGDTVAKGTGERRTFYWLRSYINQARKAVESQSGAMSDLRAKKLRLIENAKPDLVDWWSQYMNQEMYRAIYEGLSSNLSKSIAYDALGVKKRYHPNIWINDGALLLTAGTAGYSKTAAEMDTAVGSTDTAMTVLLLEQMRVKTLELKIAPIVTKKGFAFHVLVMAPHQLKALRADSTFTAATNAAFNAARLDHPALNAAQHFYAGFAIYEDLVGIRGWDNAAGGWYGDDDANPINSMFEPCTITDNYACIVFGNSMLGLGVVETLRFGYESDDFENIQEIAGISIYGANRTDFVTETNAGESSGKVFEKKTTGGVIAATAMTNQSSMIVLTT